MQRASEAYVPLLSATSRISRSSRIVKAVTSGAAARILSSALTLVSLPLAVRYLGAERYGVWATITTTVVWINLLDLGIANTLTNHVSRAYAFEDKASAAQAITNALLVTGSLSLSLGLVFVWFWHRIRWSALFNVSGNVSPGEVRFTVLAAIGLMLLALPSNLVGKVLAGYQELHLNNFAVGLGTIANLAGLAIGIWLGASMPMLFLMSAGCATFVSFAALLLVVLWYKPWLRPRISLISFRVAKELMSSGSSFFLIQVAGVVVFSSDNLVVSHYLGAAEVTPYSVTWRFVGLAAILQSLLFPALWPVYAEAYARGDFGWIRRSFSRVMKGTVALNIGAVFALMLVGRPLIRWWAGPGAVPSLYLLGAMGLWAIINGFMNVESCLLAALNRIREQAALSVVAAVVNLSLSIALVTRIGSVGVIAGTILSYVFVLVIPQSVIVRNTFRDVLRPEQAAENGRGRCREEAYLQVRR